MSQWYRITWIKNCFSTAVTVAARRARPHLSLAHGYSRGSTPRAMHVEERGRTDSATRRPKMGCICFIFSYMKWIDILMGTVYCISKQHDIFPVKGKQLLFRNKICSNLRFLLTIEIKGSSYFYFENLDFYVFS